MKLLNTYKGARSAIIWFYPPMKYQTYKGLIVVTHFPFSIEKWLKVTGHTLIAPQSSSTRS